MTGTELDAAYAAAASLMGRFAPRAGDPANVDALPGAVLCDTDWLARRVTDTVRRWDCPDDRTAGTLWWYSTSVTMTAAAPAMLLASGVAPDPDPRRATCTLTDYGYLASMRAGRLLVGGDAYARALGPALEQVIVPLARVSGASERALWAIAADALANQALAAGREAGRIAEAGTLAVQLADSTPMPVPRYVDLAPGPGAEGPNTAGDVTLLSAAPASEEPGGARRVVRRCSCCLIYQAPGEGKCVSCPRRRPDDRAQSLAEWLSRQ
ncbi:(2Fe-2S)-binding protein [Tomitella gaofuii]|uniref:(2Fe-2S)-binding protein n=1 Tax=Tomitella gaofuii TaxID=2760083 RepID=UPI0015FBBCAB|nr:(2Fe-2S)-binding protein [Tomitella gaofuii]